MNYYYGDLDSSVILGFLILGILLVFIMIPIAVFYVFCNWKLFKKCGKEGWEAIIPFYNQYVLVQLAGLNWWYFLFLIVGAISFNFSFQEFKFSYALGILTIIANFFIFYNLGKKMHKDPATTGILCTLFPYIMIPVMALSSSYKYDKDVEVSPNGPIKTEREDDTNTRFCTGCGRQLRKNAKFCEHCGKEVK